MPEANPKRKREESSEPKAVAEKIKELHYADGTFPTDEQAEALIAWVRARSALEMAENKRAFDFGVGDRGGEISDLRVLVVADRHAFAAFARTLR